MESEYYKEYYRKNREKILKRQKDYNEKHKEEKAEYDKLRKKRVKKQDGSVMGLRRENKSVYVARFPDRKRLCLVCGEGNTGTIVATFRSEEDAKLFGEYLNYVCFGGKNEKI